MRNAKTATAGILLTSALALAGCGQAETTTTTPAEPLKIAFKSPQVTSNRMPATFTCLGRNTWPTLEWGSLPPSTGSLALFVVGYYPKPASYNYKISIEWAVAGLPPTVHKLDSGKLPRYALVGINSNGKSGYSLCPPKNTQVQYQFELYGVPKDYGVASSHFYAVRLLQALSSPTSTTRAGSYGAFIARYARL